MKFKIGRKLKIFLIAFVSIFLISILVLYLSFSSRLDYVPAIMPSDASFYITIQNPVQFIHKVNSWEVSENIKNNPNLPSSLQTEVKRVTKDIEELRSKTEWLVGNLEDSFFSDQIVMAMLPNGNGKGSLVAGTRISFRPRVLEWINRTFIGKNIKTETVNNGTIVKITNNDNYYILLDDFLAISKDQNALGKILDLYNNPKKSVLEKQASFIFSQNRLLPDVDKPVLFAYFSPKQLEKSIPKKMISEDPDKAVERLERFRKINEALAGGPVKSNAFAIDISNTTPKVTMVLSRNNFHVKKQNGSYKKMMAFLPYSTCSLLKLNGGIEDFTTDFLESGLISQESVDNRYKKYRRRFGSDLRETLLPHLDKDMFFSVANVEYETEFEHIPYEFPAISGITKIKDSKLLAEALESVAKYMMEDPKRKKDYMMRVKEYKGHQLYYISRPKGMVYYGSALDPVMGIVGDYFVLSTNSAYLKEIIDLDKKMGKSLHEKNFFSKNLDEQSLLLVDASEILEEIEVLSLFFASDRIKNPIEKQKQLDFLKELFKVLRFYNILDGVVAKQTVAQDGVTITIDFVPNTSN